MKTVDKLHVLYEGRVVGTIAPFQRYLTAFEYDKGWLQDGFSISPLSLPLQPGVMISKVGNPFQGLHGIFADSLPDGWGRLLVDRMLRREGEKPEEVGPLTRLSIVGSSGMGALEYKPVLSMENDRQQISDLDRLAGECRKILQSEESDDLDALFAMGGSSGGARPKVMINLDGEDWIIKFPSSGDPAGIGKMEFDYNQCARACGIDVPDFKLFPSSSCPGYFGTRRFDRKLTPAGEKKVHMASVSALLEVSHRIPSLDYTSLMALTWKLTKQASEMMKMYTLMCFNVFAHNRDDHSNNFTFLCEDNEWHLAPAYDLTWSNSMGGEHATTINGEGRNPSMADLLMVAKKAGIKETQAKKVATKVQDVVRSNLSEYLS